MNCIFAVEPPISRNFDENRMHFCISWDFPPLLFFKPRIPSLSAEPSNSIIARKTTAKRGLASQIVRR